MEFIKNIFRSKLYCTIIVLKVILLGLFSSDYIDYLFKPFVNLFVDSGFSINVWSLYFNDIIYPNDAFPYPAMMLYLFSVPSFLLSIMLGSLYDFNILFNQELSQSSFLISNLIFKLPLFISDLAILFVLLKFFPLKKQTIGLIYFLNPIIIYSTYLHSQLDIIPISLLFLSVYFISLSKNIYASIVFGIALSMKLNLLICIPLVFIYYYKKSLYQSLMFLLIINATFIFINTPFLFSESFQNLVLFNSKQSLLFSLYLTIGNLKLYIPVLFFSLVYLHLFSQKKINIDLLIAYIAIIFTFAIFFITPSPGWYVWMIPFLCTAVLKSEIPGAKINFLGFNLMYFFYFLLLHTGIDSHNNGEVIKVYQNLIFFQNYPVSIYLENIFLRDIYYSLMLAMLLYIIFQFYQFGIKSNYIYSSQNLAIGVAGDSGSGKTRFLDLMGNILGQKSLRLESDGEHKWERGDSKWNKITHLNPKANYIHNLSRNIIQLKKNEPIKMKTYDHEKGKLSDLSTFNPKEFIFVSGLHPFYLPSLRDILDIKVFIDTNENLRHFWKIKRDSIERSKSINEVKQSINARENDFYKYIEPQKDFADIIIQYFNKSLDNEETIENESDIMLRLKIIIDANIDVENILYDLKLDYEWDYNEDLKTQYIILNEEPTINFNNFAQEKILNLKDIIYSEYNFRDGYDGFIQFILLKAIAEKLKDKI